MNSIEKAGFCFFLVGLILPVQTDVRIICVAVGAFMFIIGHHVKE